MGSGLMDTCRVKVNKSIRLPPTRTHFAAVCMCGAHQFALIGFSSLVGALNSSCIMDMARPSVSLIIINYLFRSSITALAYLNEHAT